MDINPGDETSYTSYYLAVILKYQENQYFAQNWNVPVSKPESVLNNNLVPSTKASGSCQSSFDPYDVSSNDEEYFMPNNVAETTPRRSDHAARLLPPTKLDLNSPLEAPRNWGQINPNLNDYHSNQMEIISPFWIPDITDWWRQQEGMHSKYTNLSN